jgi:DNA-binding response OmpR family regulator
VEDDADISAVLVTLLTKHGFEVSAAFSGSEALLLLEREVYDLLLLDLMLPGKSGLEVVSQLRASGNNVPVIMLTAITDKGSVAELLDAGANDYLTKPFDNRELLARIQVQLRDNASGLHAPAHDDSVPAKPDSEASTVVWGRLTCDNAAYDAFINEQPAGLSKTEFAILALLISEPRRVFTKDLIYQQVWGGEYLGDDNTINVHISKLRAKLAALDPDTDYITTVWGIGFRMSEQDCDTVG